MFCPVSAPDGKSPYITARKIDLVFSRRFSYNPAPFFRGAFDSSARKKSMREKLSNILISAAAGAAAAFGVLYWKGLPAAPPAEPAVAEQAGTGQFEELEVKRLKVTGGIWVCHSETGEPLIELKDGVILAKNEVLARYVGGLEMVGRKLQITTGDPSADDPPIFCEIGASDGGQGAYIAMLSPKGTHSVNVGFDRNETGFVVSRNNGDAAMTAQAVLPIPHKEAEPVPEASTVAPVSCTYSASGEDGSFISSGVVFVISDNTINGVNTFEERVLADGTSEDNSSALSFAEFLSSRTNDSTAMSAYVGEDGKILVSLNEFGTALQELMNKNENGYVYACTVNQ